LGFLIKFRTKQWRICPVHQELTLPNVLVCISPHPIEHFSQMI
jgi:hypothetical protein